MEEFHDPQAQIRQVPNLFPQGRSEDRQAPQPRYLRYQGSREEARAGNPVFQAWRGLNGKKEQARGHSKAEASRTRKRQEGTGSLAGDVAAERAGAQPEGDRAKLGSSGEGDFFHIEVRPKGEFQTFRTQDIGEEGGIERVAGQRSSGSWDTQKWLISKKHAHIGDNGKLVADTKDAREVLDRLGSTPEHVEADRFKAKPRPNVPESDKPTPAQDRARHENIKKAQAARHKG
jgi:hypothetical protein